MCLVVKLDDENSINIRTELRKSLKDTLYMLQECVRHSLIETEGESTQGF